MSEDEEPQHLVLGLTDDELASINSQLERDPWPAELAMFSVMWSEHCSYKSSRVLLSRFPTSAPWVVVGPGENAGVVDLGDGWWAALRIESHNHPSFVEPHQGAATGVGGIVRDVFTMGARPVALWNQIRFGPLDEAPHRYLFNGVVGGIAAYGNAVGIPTVGGEIGFDECYSGNPLVNVMCLGVLKEGQLVLSRSGSPGTRAILLGSSTGRDGIGGASLLASAAFDGASDQKRPSVQVGDPFEEKKLIEACLELFDRRLVVGIQDLGAAGLSCAASEPVARSGAGLDLDLDRVHVRESGMTASDLLMSESQERMLAFVEPDRVAEVLAVAAHWEIAASVVGEVTDTGRLRVRHGGELVADVPARALSEDAPRYHRPIGQPGWQEDLWANTVRFVVQPAIATTLLALLDQPELADKRWVYEQFDHMLNLATVIPPGHDAALLRLEGTDKGLAVSTDGNGKLCYLDPRRGSARLVWEAALNVALLGARPLALVDNLNFGNPEKTAVMWQLAESIAGISEACEALGIPVVGGNVSLYNETDGLDIYPTPVVGLLGLVEPIPRVLPRIDGAAAGMDVWLFGPEWAINLAGSAFEQVTFGHVGGRPSAPDPTLGVLSVEMARWLAGDGVAAAVHDISQGGLALALAELAICSQVGVTVSYGDWRHLFCEDPHRFLAAVAPDRRERVADKAAELGLPAMVIGSFGGNEISFDHEGARAAVDLEVATKTWREAISSRM